MFSLFIGVALIVVAFILPKFIIKEATALRRIALMLPLGIGVLFSVSGGFAYNDAGYCQHIRTVFGTESSNCKTGWYFVGWGRSTAWPHEITVANTIDPEAAGSSVSGPYRVRLADNWVGDVTQTTRFGIPQDVEQFIAMARKFRSPERLITTTLKPAVTASLDSVANMYTLEEYYAGGKRDQFKSEYKEAIEKGRARVRQVTVSRSGVNVSRAAASDSEVVKDTSEVGDTAMNKVVMEKVTDASGNVIRVKHDYAEHGITVSSAILENLDPDDTFEAQIQARKEAASRRIVAREQRLEQEEQRLLAIQAGETQIAKRQAEAKVVQIQQTTDAETKKKLSLIEAERQKEEAEIAKQTAALQLEKARIDAESVQVTADAEAYAKEAILKADGALQQKLAAWVQAQRVWSQAAAQINVPTTVFNSGGETGSVNGNAISTIDQFMSMMMMKTAKDLNVDPSITK